MSGAQLSARSSDALVAQIGAAEQVLQVRPLRDENVHAARKTIKSARAALRLSRDRLGEAAYKKENRALRDAGRCLAALRDAKSLAEAWERFRARHAAVLTGKGYGVLDKYLRANLAAHHRALVRSPASLQQCSATLNSCRMRLLKCGAALRGDEAASGLKRIFRAGRKALETARRERTPDALHEWRKHVKYLSNALKIIDGDIKRGRQLANRTATLAAQLGEDHDLAELDRYIAAFETTSLTVQDRSLLSTLIERRRSVLQKRAFILGKCIYAEKPAQFIHRLAGTHGGKHR